MRKQVSLILVVLLSMSMLTGCSQGTSSQKNKVFKIGIDNFGQANFFARTGRASMTDEIKKDGGEVIATVSDTVPARTAAIENMIAQNVDAIIVEEGAMSDVEPALAEAKKKGIIIGSMDGGDSASVDVWATSDNTLLGTESAKKLCELTGGKGNIVVIYNDAGAMIRTRVAALHDVLANYPNMHISDSFVYAWPDYNADVRAKMEAVLQAEKKPGDIVGVFASFDGAGVAAAQAIREAGLQKYISVVGIDGDPEAYKEMQIAGSPFKFTMAQDPDSIARKVVDAVFELLKGNKIPERIIYVPGKPVTKDTIPAGS